MRKLLLAFLLPLLALAACEKETLDQSVQDDTVDLPVFHATTGHQSTKTAIDAALNILWQEGDEISIFPKTNSNIKYKLSEGAGSTSGTFNPDPAANPGGNVITQNIAVYPYSSSISLTENSGDADPVIKGIKIPSIQKYYKDTYDPKALIMLAKSDNEQLDFKNMDGILEIQLTGNATIKSITVKGNNNEMIAGDTDLKIETNNQYSLENYSQDFATVISEEGVTLSDSPTTFRIVLHPTDFTQGFTVTIIDTEGMQMEKTTSTQCEIKRNEILSMPSLAYEGSASSTYTPGLREVWVKTVTGEKPEKCRTEYYTLADKINPLGYWVYTSSNPYPEYIATGAFSEFTDLKEVWIGEGTAYLNRTTFSGCSELETVIFPSTLKGMGGFEFSHCVSLKSINLPEGFEGFFIKDPELEFTSQFEYCTSLESIEIPASVSKLANFLFEGCTALKTVTLHEGLKIIGPNCFQDCTSLETMDLPSSLTQIDNYAFQGAGLKHLNISPNTQNLILNGECLYNCSLENLTLQGGVTVNKDAFNRTTINHLTISKSVSKIEYGAFSYNHPSSDEIRAAKIQTLTILITPDTPDKLAENFITDDTSKETDLILRQEWKTATGDWLPTDARWAGVQWKSIKFCDENGIIIQEEEKLQKDYEIWVKTVDGTNNNVVFDSYNYIISETTNEQGYFVISQKDKRRITKLYNNVFGVKDPLKDVHDNLKEIKLPDYVAEIPIRSFRNCTALETVIFPDETEVTLGQYVFENAGLRSIIIPANVKPQGYWLFQNCKKLDEVTFYSPYLSGQCFVGCSTLDVLRFLSKDLIIDGGFLIEDNMQPSFWIDLVLNIEYANKHTEGNEHADLNARTWYGKTWKSITLVSVDAEGNTTVVETSKQ